MKSLLVFLSGMLVTVIGAGAAAYFLFYQPATESVRDLPGMVDAKVVSPEDRFTISGTIIVPEELKSVIQSGKGKLLISLISGRESGIELPLGPNVIRPNFPYHFSFTLSKSALTHNPKIKEGLGLLVKYAPDEKNKPGASYVYFEPTSIVIRFLPFTEQQILKGALPETYNTGSLPLGRYMARVVTDPCLSSDVLLSGKIVPTPRFLQKHGHDKFALLVYEDSFAEFGGAKSHPEDHILHSQFMDFSSGASAFSVPMQKNRFPYYLVYGVKCETGDTALACARRALPIEPMVDQNKHRFIIGGSHREAAFCGTKDFVGIIDQADYLSPLLSRNPEAFAGEKNQ